MVGSAPLPRFARGFTSALATLVVAVVVLAACGATGPAGNARPLVVTTTTHLADFATAIGGDAVEVYSLLRPNIDAHDFEPSPADIDALARADVIVANGVGLEPWLAAAVQASGTTVEVTDTSEGVLLLRGDEPDHDHAVGSATEVEDSNRGGWNPHIWLDPQNARVMAANVADALAVALPSSATAIAARADGYDTELKALDVELSLQLADLTSRKLVTDHDAFTYFAAHFDLEVVGSVIPSFDSSAEVSAGDLAALAELIERESVSAIFTEQSLPDDAAQALARRVDVVVVSGESGLYADSLGAPGSAGGTYLEMMRHNARTIAEHLR